MGDTPKLSPGPWTSIDQVTILDAERNVIAGVVRRADVPLVIAARGMLDLIREAIPATPHQHADPFTCWFCRAKRLLDPIDGKPPTT